MTALLHPGVYVQEVPGGVRSIEGVPTSTTIFVGETERGPTTATKIKGVSDYERLFGGYLRHPTTAPTRVCLRYAIDSFYRNGGSTAYVLRAIGTEEGPTADPGDDEEPATASRDYTTLDPDEGGPGTAQTWSDVVYASSPGTWGNDLHVLFGASTDGDVARFRLVVFVHNHATDELEFVEDWDRLSLDGSDENYVVDVLARSAYITWNSGSGFALTNFNDQTSTFTSANPADWNISTLAGAAKLSGGLCGEADFDTAQLGTLLAHLDGIDDAALIVAAPSAWLSAGSNGHTGWFDALRTYVDARPKLDLFLIGDLPRQAGDTATQATSDTRTVVTGLTTSNMAASYWPHLEVADPVGAGRSATVHIPPSAAVAGLYARTDSRRGVWKAPAGTEATIGGIVGLEHALLDTHQDDLNPIGVNALRVIPGAGTVVWGSRTLRPSSEWRYVPVRRTAMFLRKSIYNGIQWAVFEPNDEDLWASLRATIGAFMNIQFRNGAFAGTSARDAYFVKVDAETTTEADQAAGIVNILVGFAPLRPAEFVVVKLSQKTASNS